MIFTLKTKFIKTIEVEKVTQVGINDLGNQAHIEAMVDKADEQTLC